MSGAAGVAAHLLQKRFARKRKATGRAVGARKSRSRTVTRTKKKFSVNKATKSGESVYSSFFSWRKRQQKLFKNVKRIGAPNWAYSNGTARIDGAVGKQTTYIVTKLFDAKSIDDIFGNVLSNKAMKIQLHNCSARMRFQNQSLTYADVTIYDIISFRDLSTKESDTTVDISYADVAWAQGITDEGGSASATNMIGTTPFMSQTFRQFYRIKKVTTARLPSGWTHEHKVNLAPMQYIARERLNYQGTGKGANIGNLTYQCMIVVNGGVANDSVTKTQVSTVAPHLDAIIDWRYKYSWIADTTETAITTNNLPTAFTVNPEFVNEYTSVVAVGDAPA